MRFICEICDVHCSSAVLLEEHYLGKRHVNVVEETQRLREIAERSVDVENVHSVVAEFGEVERVLLDKNNFSYAIVEFRKPNNAQNLLNSLKKLKIGENLVNVSRRKVNFDVTQKSDPVNAKSVNKCLQNVAFSDQIDALIMSFALSNEQKNQRHEFAKILEKFLQKYFALTVEIRIFGSTTTGLAFLTSDIDLNFILKDENGKAIDFVTPLSSTASPSSNFDCKTNEVDNHSDAAAIPIVPLSKLAFLELSKSERVRLLTRLINEFRKKTGTISKITPALDAKCPVVRFVLRQNIGSLKQKRAGHVTCELSAGNLLGEKKANFVKDVIDADSSGNLQKIFFIVKLWAHCNGIFAPYFQQQALSKTYLNSYTISLLVVSFLQFKKILKPLTMSENTSTLIQGWQTEYSLQTIDLSGINFSSFIKDLFKYLYNFVQNLNVHCIRDGFVYQKKEFEQKMLIRLSSVAVENFKWALVNVQDPLELTHNVSKNVSRKVLARFRAALMFSIFALKKQNNDDISVVFQKDQLEASFCADTEINYARNTEQKLEKDLITLYRDKSQLPESVIFECFSSLLTDVLLCEQIEEPTTKRCRSTALCSRDKSLEFLAHDYHFKFCINFATWLGRRSLRKKLHSGLKKKCTQLQLEKEVSKELKAKSELHSIKFCFAVRLFLEERRLVKNETLTGCSQNTGAERELYARFWSLPHPDVVDKDLALQANSFREMIHFLSTFVPNHLSLLLPQMKPETVVFREQRIEGENDDNNLLISFVPKVNENVLSKIEANERTRKDDEESMEIG